MGECYVVSLQKLLSWHNELCIMLLEGNLLGSSLIHGTASGAES